MLQFSLSIAFSEPTIWDADLSHNILQTSWDTDIHELNNISNEWPVWKYEKETKVHYLPKCASELLTPSLEELWSAETDWRFCPDLSDLSSVNQWQTPGPYRDQTALCSKTIGDERTVLMSSRQDSINFTCCIWLKRKWVNIRRYGALAGRTAHSDELQRHFFSFFYRARTCTGEWTVTSGGVKLPLGESCLINSHPLTLAFQRGGSEGELKRRRGVCDERFMSSGDVRMKIGVLCQCKWKGCCNQMSP